MDFVHIHLGNWRNFTKVDVPLRRRVFLVGPNASGKSNLLNAFRFLSDLVRPGGGLQKAIEDRGGLSRIRCLAARRETDITVDATVSDGEDDYWRYELKLAQESRGQRKPFVKHERVSRNGIVITERSVSGTDRDLFRQTLLEQATTNREFVPLVKFFGSISYFHVVPQLIREPDRSNVRLGSNDPFGSDFLYRIATAPQRTRTARLARITRALQVAVPQLSELELTKDEVGRPHLRGKYEHWRGNAAWQSEADFSDGTLRLLGLLWSLLDGEGPLLLEEPELSLHQEVVKHLSQMIARLQRTHPRQIIVSSHSTDLLSDTGIAADEVLLLAPSPNGTEVTSAAKLRTIVTLMREGLSAAEAVLPFTKPANIAQLSLFGD